MNKNKKQIFALVAGVIILVVAVMGIFLFVHGMNDDKQQALKGVEKIFTVTEKSCLNRYLQYNDFEEMFYKNDIGFCGELYEEMEGMTIQADVDGSIDKSNRLAKAGFQVGLGGMPFAEFQVYSDDTNLYGATEFAEDKLLFFNYKGDLKQEGSRIGLSPAGVRIFQKLYIEFFEYFVSTQKNSRLQKLLENEQIHLDLMEIYDSMKVEKEENFNQADSGVVYHVMIPSGEIETLISDLCTQFDEFQTQGYAEIVEKFISSQGVIFHVRVPKQENTSEIVIENPDNGYVLTLTREEQEKEGKMGFCENLTASLVQDDRSIFHGIFGLDFNNQGNKISVSFSETENQINGSISGILTTDKKNQKISLYMEEIELSYHNAALDLRGNVQISYGEFPVTLPEAETVDILHGSEQERNQLKNQLGQELTGRVGNVIRKLLKCIGISL